MSTAYPDEVRHRAIRLSASGLSDAKVAAEVGASEQACRVWRNAAGISRISGYDRAPVEIGEIGNRRGGRGGCGAIEVSQETKTWSSVVNQRMPG